jgi:hypothetical protein
MTAIDLNLRAFPAAPRQPIPGDAFRDSQLPGSPSDHSCVLGLDAVADPDDCGHL